MWVDTDSKVNLYPNCTAYNSDMDDSAQVAMCNALSFEALDWIPVGGEGSSEVALSDMDVADGDTSLRVSQPFSKLREKATQLYGQTKGDHFRDTGRELMVDYDFPRDQ